MGWAEHLADGPEVPAGLQLGLISGSSGRLAVGAWGVVYEAGAGPSLGPPGGG